MRFAIVCGKKAEATHGAKGLCVSCESELIAKCGEIKVWHWAHRAKPPCDRWWENETEWHRAWKGHFPVDWQEVVHRAESGERHIADVKTDREWVLEFQHSHLTPEERRAREAFYSKLIWIVDGTRRKRDTAQFFRMLTENARLRERPRMWRLRPDDYALLREWSSCRAPVLFDFGQVSEFGGDDLWCQLNVGQSAYLIAVPRGEFIGFHYSSTGQVGVDFADVLQKIRQLISLDLQLREAQARILSAGQSQPGGFQRYLARRERSRRRF